MRNARKLKGSFVSTATAWGEHLTADHITSLNDNMLGVTGDRDAFVVKDVFTGLKHLYPTKSKHAVDTEQSLQQFIGNRSAKMLYCDRAGAINSASKTIRIYQWKTNRGCRNTTPL